MLFLIGNGLSKLTRLESLNLAGNCFSSFQEVIKLNKLPSLKYLVLKVSFHFMNFKLLKLPEKKVFTKFVHKHMLYFFYYLFSSQSSTLKYLV